MLFLRSLLFNGCFFVMTAIFSSLVLCFRLFGHAPAWFWARQWTNTTLFLVRYICGIKLQIEGVEHIPDTACVLMAKHQSAFETLLMPCLIPPFVWIMKRELFYIPFFGWALWVMKTIGIRRGNPREAIKQVNTDGSKLLKQGYWVVVFPEGTRSSIGTSGDYKAGGIVLAQKANVGILPMAHNAATCWPKRGFIKKPGLITIRFLPFIPADIVSSSNRKELLHTLKHDIEAHTRQIGG
ncbi:MAG: lysophospholipid acyltransferase family protein [Mariprofundaceae bacterium]|nr:lysophospholipid acyltransferase family protein [Mariprofundaceae bacterium]